MPSRFHYHAEAALRAHRVHRAGIQFTCFTSTRVQILTLFECIDEPYITAADARVPQHRHQFTGFTSTRVQILTQQQHIDQPYMSQQMLVSLDTRTLTYADVC